MPRIVPPRLLLLEFLNVDRYSQYRSELFPFVRARAEALGVQVEWIAVGFSRETLPTSPFLMALPEDVGASVISAIARVRPTHILLNEELDATLSAELSAVAADARRGVYGLSGGPLFHRVGDVDEWLGLERPSTAEQQLILDAVTPSWRCTLLGDLAATVLPFVQVQGGPICVYARPLSHNGSFDGVDLSRAQSAVGCSFCGDASERGYPYETPPVALALRQIRAAIATCPPDRGGRAFAIGGAPIFLRLRELVETLLDEGLSDLELHVSCRIDELCRKARDLDVLLPRMAVRGISLHVANMGVENFSQEENERFNKGISAGDVEEVVGHIARWERDWPRTFHFSDCGGFGFILFTPWTELRDIRVNLSYAERLGLSPDLLIRSRVQLMPGRALTFLAERDGLLVPSDDEVALEGFNSGCIMSADEAEIPWRFRSPIVACLYAVLARLRWVGEPVPEDALGVQIRTTLRRLSEGYRSPFRFVELLLRAAEEVGASASPGELLVAAEARAEDSVVPPPPSLKLLAVVADDELEDTRTNYTRQAREVLDLLARHPKRLLRGFEGCSVIAQATGRDWGEISVLLERKRDGSVIRLLLMSAVAVAHPYQRTERFAVTHDKSTPIDSDDKERVVDVFLRGLERYSAAQARARGRREREPRGSDGMARGSETSPKPASGER